MGPGFSFLGYTLVNGVMCCLQLVDILEKTLNNLPREEKSRIAATDQIPGSRKNLWNQLAERVRVCFVAATEK